MKDFIRCIVIIFVLLGAFGLAILKAFSDVKTANKHWNNGICELCGGTYQFSGGSHVLNGGDRFYYTCEDCGHTIITYSLKK